MKVLREIINEIAKRKIERTIKRIEREFEKK